MKEMLQLNKVLMYSRFKSLLFVLKSLHGSLERLRILKEMVPLEVKMMLFIKTSCLLKPIVCHCDVKHK